MSERSTPVLQADDITVRYGGVIANNAVNLTVHPGEIVGLIGPNGAGKTTFVDALSGFAPSTGRVTVAGRRVDHLSAHRRRAAGMARTWQSGELFGDLTIAENIMVAARGVGFRVLLADLFRRGAPHDLGVERALSAVGLSDVAHKRPSELSLGQQKLVGVARALAGGTKVLLLDEPAAGLDTHESVHFGTEIRQIARDGVGILLIDHDMALVLEVCDRVFVIDFGRIIATGTPDAIRDDQAVVDAYLGSPESLGEVEA